MKKQLLTQKIVFLLLFLAGHQLMGTSQAPAKSGPMDVTIEVRDARQRHPDMIIDVPCIGGFMDGDNEVAAITTSKADVDAKEPKTAPATDDKADDTGIKAEDDRPLSQPVRPRVRASQKQRAIDKAKDEAKKASSKDAEENPKEAKRSEKTQAMIIEPTTEEIKQFQASKILLFDEKTPSLMAFTPTFYAPFTPYNECKFPTVESYLRADSLSGFYYLFFIKIIQAKTLDELKGIIRAELPYAIFDERAMVARPINRPGDVTSIRRQLLDCTKKPTIKELADMVLEKYLGREGHSQYDPSTANLRLYIALKFQIFEHKELQKILESTGNSVLRYLSEDPFFGCGSDDKGANYLGQTLMRIREEIRHNDWTPVR